MRARVVYMLAAKVWYGASIPVVARLDITLAHHAVPCD
jgi:hypothetical protein